MQDRLVYSKKGPGCKTGYSIEEAQQKLSQVKILLSGQPDYNKFSIEKDDRGGFLVVAEAKIIEHEHTRDNDDGRGL